MQTVQQPDLSAGARFWRALVKLDFISKFFAWLMEFLARVTEPLAACATIYIIIVAGVPVLMSDGWYTFSLALIIGSPELLLVGAMKMAMRELGRGNKKAWWLMAACLALLTLTALTVSDLFMWHWPAGAVQMLMGFRCLAGLGYTIARGICTDREEEVNLAPGSPARALLEEFMVNLTARVLAEVNQAHQHLLAEVNRVNQATLTEVHSLVQRVNQAHQQLLAEVNGMNQGIQADLQATISVLGQQNQQALDAAVERLERSHSRRIEAVYTRLEQVRITMESNPSLPTVPAPSRSQFRQLPRATQSVHQSGSEPPGQLREVHGALVNPAEVNNGESSRSKVNAGRTFTVNHYQENGVLPKLEVIQAAVICSKTLASRIRGEVATELGLASTSSRE